MKKGEVWIIEIPGADGREQRGLRPAIFIADTHTSVGIVVPCTANPQALRFPFTMRLEPSRGNGLDVLSVALVFQIRAIDKKRLLKKVGKLEKTAIKELDIIMRKLFNFDG